MYMYILVCSTQLFIYYYINYYKLLCVYNNNYICFVSKATAHNNYATEGRSALFDFISLKNGKDTMKMS